MVEIRDYFKLDPEDGDVGVEIEVEGELLPRPPKGWRSEADDSLRGESREYVLEKPVPIIDLKTSLASLKKTFVDKGAIWGSSYRAGVHVHVNVQKLTPLQLANMITTYYLFENAIVAKCDPFRVGNHFCLRAKDAEWQVKNLIGIIQNSHLGDLNDDNMRYSAMNLKAVPRYGSVEFRSLESTYDFDKINTFAEVHKSIRDFATTMVNPKKIVEHADAVGPFSLARGIFQKNADWLIGDDNFVRNFLDGQDVAEDIAYCRQWGIKNLDIFDKRQNIF